MTPLSQGGLKTILQLADSYDPDFQMEDVNGLYSEAFSAALSGCRKGRWTVLSAQKECIAQISQIAGNTLLNHAIAEREDQWVENLIRYEIDIHSRDFEGNSALHIAAKYGLCHWIDRLLGFNAIDAKNNKGQTPLHLAIEFGQAPFLETLMHKGASVTLPISIGDQFALTLNPLGFAIMKGQKECVNALMKSPKCIATVKFTCVNVGSLLHVAVYFYQFDILRHLLENYKSYFDIESQNSEGLTPLSLAAYLGQQEAIRILHKYGASIEAKDFNDYHPMHRASQGCHPDAIQLLAFLGAKISPKDPELYRPLDLVRGMPGDRAKTCTNLLINLSKNKEARKFDPTPSLESPTNLVFKGGGVKGLAYLGAIKSLHQKNLLQSVERIAGTSAGAITATLLAINFPVDELTQLLSKTNLVEILLDHPLSKKKLKAPFQDPNIVDFITNLYSIYDRVQQAINNPLSIVTSLLKGIYRFTGLCEGEEFRKWLENTMKQQVKIDHLTFGELAELIKQGKPYKHLHVFTTKVGTNSEIVCLSSDASKWKDIIISDAVRASMSIPGVFEPHILHAKINNERIPAPQFGSFLDGGMLYNFPVEAFDQKRYFTREDLGAEGSCPKFNKQTLGFSLYSSLDKKCSDKGNMDTIFDLLFGICNVYLGAESSIRQLNPYNACRVIEIDTEDVGTLSFALDEKMQKKLIESGLKATEQFIDKNLSKTITPINSPPIVHTPMIKSDIPFPSIAFGQSKWAVHFGDIGAEFPLPEKIHEILNAPCPFWPDKMVKETHALIFKPKIVNGKLYDIFLLGELLKAPRSSSIIKTSWPSLEVPKVAKDSDAYWYLITRRPIPESTGKSFVQQKKMIEDLNYQAPKFVEVATEIACTFLDTKELLYTTTVTRTEERHTLYQYCVGSPSDTLSISSYPNQQEVGLSACRRFL